MVAEYGVFTLPPGREVRMIFTSEAAASDERRRHVIKERDKTRTALYIGYQVSLSARLREIGEQSQVSGVSGNQAVTRNVRGITKASISH